MICVKTYLDRGQYGTGLFAGEFIPKDTIVYKHDPRFTIIVKNSEIDALPEAARDEFYKLSYKRKGEYRLEDAVNYDIDAAKYMNHSFDSNLLYIPEPETYIAKWDIQEGEELTCNYGEFAEWGDPCYNW